MANWNSTTATVERWDPRPVDGFDGWLAVDCGCCAGIQWGGEDPVPCGSCGEGGWLYVHIESGVTAWWPGGPLSGRLSAHDRASLVPNGRSAE